ncbi:cation transporter, partial [Paracoccus sp. FO-3]
MRDENAERVEWTVTGMDCAACTRKIAAAVERMPGVGEVSVGLMAEKLSLTLHPDGTSRDQIEDTVRRLGFGIAPRGQEAPRKKAFVLPDAAPAAAVAPAAVPATHGHDHGAARGQRWHRTAKGRLVVMTGVLLAAAWAFELLTTAEWGYWAFLLACVIGVAPVAQRAFAALRMGQPFTIESLMTIAAVGALFIGAAEEAALVVFLFALGEVLEGVA